MQVGSPEKMKWKINLVPVGLNWQITLALGVENHFGPTPAKVENYYGPRHVINGYCGKYILEIIVFLL